MSPGSPDRLRLLWSSLTKTDGSFLPVFRLKSFLIKVRPFYAGTLLSVAWVSTSNTLDGLEKANVQSVMHSPKLCCGQACSYNVVCTYMSG